MIDGDVLTLEIAAFAKTPTPGRACAPGRGSGLPRAGGAKIRYILAHGQTAWPRQRAPAGVQRPARSEPNCRRDKCGHSQRPPPSRRCKNLVRGGPPSDGSGHRCPVDRGKRQSFDLASFCHRDQTRGLPQSSLKKWRMDFAGPSPRRGEAVSGFGTYRRTER